MITKLDIETPDGKTTYIVTTNDDGSFISMDESTYDTLVTESAPTA